MSWSVERSYITSEMVSQIVFVITYMNLDQDEMQI